MENLYRPPRPGKSLRWDLVQVEIDGNKTTIDVDEISQVRIRRQNAIFHSIPNMVPGRLTELIFFHEGGNGFIGRNFPDPEGLRDDDGHTGSIFRIDHPFFIGQMNQAFDVGIVFKNVVL